MFQDKKNKYANLTPDLSPGECILLDTYGDHYLQGPIWSQEAIRRMAETAKPAPEIVEEFEVPKEFGRLHIVDGGKRA